MAFGAVRGAYKAPCKFFADDSVADNRIIWYYVPDGTPIYDGWTVFWPRVDVALKDANSKYEREGLGVAVRQHFLGMPGYGFPGTHVHGDDDDFQGKSLREKYFADGPPSAPCPTPQINIPIAFGLTVNNPTPPEGVICSICEETPLPEHIPLYFDTPDFPGADLFLTGKGVTYETGSAPDCVWSFFQSDGFGNFIILNLETVIVGGVPTLSFSMFYDDIFGNAFTLPPTTFDHTCDPFSFSVTIEAHEFGPSGKFVTVSTHPIETTIKVPLALTLEVSDPSSDTIPIGLAMRLDVTDPDPSLSVIVPIAITVLVDDVP